MQPITLTPVKSSNISAVGYDPHSQTLAVQFLSGAQPHHYRPVQQPTADALLKAESVGRAFAQLIRGKFTPLTAEQLADPAADEVVYEGSTPD